MTQRVAMLSVVMLTACGDEEQPVVADGTGAVEGETGGALTGGAPDGTTGGGGAEPNDECDPIAQDCPEGSKCTFLLGDADLAEGYNVCVPVDGTDPIGAACERDETTGVDSCVAGAHCLESAEAPQCVPFCSTEDMCADADQLCITRFEGRLPLCLSECHPLVNDCPFDWSCFEDPGIRRWYCQPSLPGAGGLHGEPCELQEFGLCAEGNVCMNPLKVAHDGCSDPTISGCCTPLCDVTDPAFTCPGEGEQCVDYFQMMPDPPGLENVGVCVVP